MQIKIWHWAALCCLGTLIVLGLLSLFASSGGAEESSQPSALSPQVGLEIADTAPEFSFTSTDGESIQSSDLRGKIIVLTSTAVWCSSCVAEALQHAAVYAAHRDDPIVFLTIDIDPRNSVEVIDQFRKDYVTPWSYGQSVSAKQLIDNYRLKRFEITYVIDQDGVIRYKDAQITSFYELEEALSSLL